MKAAIVSILVSFCSVYFAEAYYGAGQILRRNQFPSPVSRKVQHLKPRFTRKDFDVRAASGPASQNLNSVGNVERKLMDPTFDDMKEMGIILADISDCLEKEPEKAISIASQKMGWLYARNLPKLTEMMLKEFPQFRKDTGMMKAYLFVLDFLEVVVKEVETMQKTNQRALRTLLEAAKVSEQQVDQAIQDNKETVSISIALRSRQHAGVIVHLFLSCYV
jgi:hypothetical protein